MDGFKTPPRRLLRKHARVVSPTISASDAKGAAKDDDKFGFTVKQARAEATQRNVKARLASPVKESYKAASKYYRLQASQLQDKLFELGSVDQSAVPSKNVDHKIVLAEHHQAVVTLVSDLTSSLVELELAWQDGRSDSTRFKQCVDHHMQQVIRFKNQTTRNFVLYSALADIMLETE